MAIESKCDGCGVQLRVADEHAGRQARCPQCGNLYTVPTDASPAGAPPTPPTSPQPVSVSHDVPEENRANSEDIWYVQTPEGQTFGPVEKHVLDDWTSQGRVNAQCQLRKSESGAWQSAVNIYPQLASNPFRDNPYSSPQTGTTQFRETHRGVLILVFAILGFLVCVAFSPAAWIMGRGDLKKMDAGIMDPEGRTLTQVGMILGAIQSCLMLVGAIIALLWLVFVIGLGAMNM